MSHRTLGFDVGKNSEEHSAAGPLTLFMTEVYEGMELCDTEDGLSLEPSKISLGAPAV